MNLKTFSVYDDKAKAFLPPFFLPESGMAARVFKDCVNSKEHQFGQNPDDYTLFHVGSFCQNTGTLASMAPKTLGNGVLFVTPETNLEQSNGQTQIGNEASVLPSTESDDPSE